MAFDTVNHHFCSNNSGVILRYDGLNRICLIDSSWIGIVGSCRCPTVTQGAALEPLMFTCYVARIFRLIDDYGIGYHKYADNAKTYAAPDIALSGCLNQLPECTVDLQLWYWRNDLLRNPDKSEVCLFGTRQQFQRLILPSLVKVAVCCVDVSRS